jgi:hypothetical protein
VIDGRAESPAAAAKITRAELPAAAANYRRKNCLLLLPQTALRFSCLGFRCLILQPLDLWHVRKIAIEVSSEPAAHLFKVYIHRAK